MSYKYDFFDVRYLMIILFLPDIKELLNALAKSGDTKSSFTFSLVAYQELLERQYYVGYFYINGSESITIYNDFYPLFKKIVSIFHGNIRKYVLSAEFIIIPLESNWLLKIKRNI